MFQQKMSGMIDKVVSIVLMMILTDIKRGYPNDLMISMKSIEQKYVYHMFIYSISYCLQMFTSQLSIRHGLKYNPHNKIVDPLKYY